MPGAQPGEGTLEIPTFTAYEARDVPGRFYLCEIYDDDAFDVHLRTSHVRAFISSIPALSTGGLGSLIQLNEITIPETQQVTDRDC